MIKFISASAFFLALIFISCQTNKPEPVNDALALNIDSTVKAQDDFFMFANGKEADAVVDGPFGKKLHAKLDAKGLLQRHAVRIFLDRV